MEEQAEELRRLREGGGAAPCEEAEEADVQGLEEEEAEEEGMEQEEEWRAAEEMMAEVEPGAEEQLEAQEEVEEEQEVEVASPSFSEVEAAVEAEEEAEVAAVAVAEEEGTSQQQVQRLKDELQRVSSHARELAEFLEVGLQPLTPAAPPAPGHTAPCYPRHTPPGRWRRRRRSCRRAS